MVKIVVMFISIVSSSIYASDGNEKKLVGQYLSHEGREERIRNRVNQHIATTKQLGGEKIFKDHPLAYTLYKAEIALANKQLSLESPQLTAEIRELRKSYSPERLHSDSSASNKIAPLELESTCDYKQASKEEQPARVSVTQKPLIAADPCCAFQCIIF